MMQEDKKELFEDEDPPEYPGPPEPLEESPRRNRRPARLYYGSVALGMFLFLLLCVIALGSFGEFQRQLSGFYTPGNSNYGRRDLCILYAKTQPYSKPKEDGATWGIEYQGYGPCIFIFWGLVSGTLLAVGLLVYSIAMVIIGPRILACLRLLDTILCFLGSLGFFAFSVAITAGLSSTCHGPISAGGTCVRSSLINSDKRQLRFYGPVSTAQNCSWIIMVFLLLLGIWNLILLIIYFRQRRKRSRQLMEERSTSVV